MDGRAIVEREEAANEGRGCPGPDGIMESLFWSSLPPSDFRPVDEVGICETPFVAVEAPGATDLRGTARPGPREVRELSVEALTGASGGLLLID